MYDEREVKILRSFVTIYFDTKQYSVGNRYFY